jgi:hypothetical protein
MKPLFGTILFDEPVKSPISDGSVKSAEIKACEPRGMRRIEDTPQ